MPIYSWDSCKEVVEDVFVVCIECNDIFCVKYSEILNYQKGTKNSKSWKCLKCTGNKIQENKDSIKHQTLNNFEEIKNNLNKIMSKIEEIQMLHHMLQKYNTVIQELEIKTDIKKVMQEVLKINNENNTVIQILKDELENLQYCSNPIFDIPNKEVEDDKEIIEKAQQVVNLNKEEDVIQPIAGVTSNSILILSRLLCIIVSVLTLWYGLALSGKETINIEEGYFNVAPVRLSLLAAICLFQAYLMFNFVSQQLSKVRESKDPQSATNKNIKNKKEKPKKGAGTLVFGSAKTDTTSANTSEVKDDETENHPETGDDNYDPHYEPIVPLPDATLVKTGEEEEEVLFMERTKLYRYTAEWQERDVGQLKILHHLVNVKTGEEEEEVLFMERAKLYRYTVAAGYGKWKERGVGQLKILHHLVNDTYRLFMRREQVHKLVLNQHISSDLNLQPMKLFDCVWFWCGYNHTDDGSSLETLAVKLKNPDIAQQFYNVIQDVLSKIQINQSKKESEQEETEVGSDNEEYASDDSDETRVTMFSKNCTLSMKEENDWKVLGMGVLKIYYDSDLYGSRIVMYDDNEVELSNTIISINTKMKVEETTFIWRAMEWSLNPAVPRILKAMFSSTAAAEEMFYNFNESMQYAQESEIVDNLPDENFNLF